jgi:flagellar basal-body rod protein FlgF
MPIINGMTRAAHALHYYERRQEILANNLANADTNGFKAERVFAQIIGDALPAAGTATDRTAGSLKVTGEPLDLALGGEGFLVVETPQGERLSRGGSFQLDAEGRIVDANGNALLGEGGPLVVSGGSVEIDSAGAVSVDGKEIGRLRVDSVPAGAQLAHAGANLFLPDAAGQPLPEEQRLVKQGSLEASNVNTVGSLVDMIEIQRAYSAVQRAVTTLDDIRSTIANEIGKPV